MTLPLFFEAMSGLVAGRMSGSLVEARLGPSPSGRRRLELYAELVRRQHAQLLDALFPGLARAAEAVSAGLWSRLQRDYEGKHPPRHWEPNAFGERMPDYLEELSAEDRAIPPHLAEIADLEYLEWLVTVAPRTSHLPFGDDTMHVRRYEHDVLSFLRQGGCAPLRAPPARPIVLVVCRARTTDERFLLHASPAALAAIARRVGEPVPAGAGSSDRIDAAERELVDWGVLARD